jgi:hypothetical protein
MPSFGFNKKDGETPAPIPVGDYEVMIRSSDFKETKSGGERLLLGVDVIAGTYAGRRIWHPINTQGSPGAISHGKKALAKLLEALGIDEIKETEELHDLPVVAMVDIEKSYEYDDKNTINGWRRIEDNGEASRAAPLKEAARRSFLSNGQPAPAAKPAAPRLTAAQIVDDEMPF